jgi:hypothetical protein
MECNSSKSTNCKTGSMRNKKICAYFSKPSSKSAWHAHTVEELEKELATSKTTPISPEGKSTESKCNKTMVDLITQIPVEYHIHTTIISEYIKCGIT